jgi:hypothetical protein
MLVRSGLLGTTRPATEEELFCATLPFDFKYYCELRASIERGENNFVVLDPALNKVLFSNEHWVVTENAFPNSRPCAVMLMIVSKKPWRMLKDIVPEAWTTLGRCTCTGIFGFQMALAHSLFLSSRARLIAPLTSREQRALQSATKPVNAPNLREPHGLEGATPYGLPLFQCPGFIVQSLVPYRGLHACDILEIYPPK